VEAKDEHSYRWWFHAYGTLMEGVAGRAVQLFALLASEPG